MVLTVALISLLVCSVATQDAVLLYDTQQPSPVAIFVGLHYSGFTDLAWSPDGQTLMLSSIDGYCSVIVRTLVLFPLYSRNNSLSSTATNTTGLRPRGARNSPPNATAPEAAPSNCLPPLWRRATAPGVFLLRLPLDIVAALASSLAHNARTARRWNWRVLRWWGRIFGY